ncbi:hypothetical protein ACTHSJ_28445 [Paenibacillus cellulositrophicus]|uniref:hypothetical protein n=1 Tax=Paenibacillus cellulositrophicus TaxID=562959 RepID=UPI0020402FA8|nr:hypothetical protein [Paenibacillus cellulositrophicus]MCM3002045.1 hypothetical protein [Paenibacillus cellulositrophicus]
MVQKNEIISDEIIHIEKQLQEIAAVFLLLACLTRMILDSCVACFVLVCLHAQVAD